MKIFFHGKLAGILARWARGVRSVGFRGKLLDFLVWLRDLGSFMGRRMGRDREGGDGGKGEEGEDELTAGT